MKSQVEEVKQIAAQLLAGMLANPHIDPQAYLTENRKLSSKQVELVETAIALAESLVEKTEAQMEQHFQHHLS